MEIVKTVVSHAVTTKIQPIINAHLIIICGHRSVLKHLIQTSKEKAWSHLSALVWHINIMLGAQMLTCCSVILIYLLILQIVYIFNRFKENYLTCHISHHLLKIVQQHKLLMEIKSVVILICKIMFTAVLYSLH